jgi:hypothetical protein
MRTIWTFFRYHGVLTVLGKNSAMRAMLEQAELDMPIQWKRHGC